MKSPRADFVVMAKPVGPRCNMRCSYCYYRDCPGGSTPEEPMSDAVLEAFIANYMESVTGPVVSFTWHGGEPTLAGLPFYEKVVALEEKYRPQGWEIWNSLQTNGLLLDAEWADFLARERFDVGISIDGPRWLHDLHRKDEKGRGTFDRVLRAVECLAARGIQPDLLCTVSETTAKAGIETYKALRALKTGWMQFIPIVEHDPKGRPVKETVSPEAYGEFLKDVFSCWFFHDLDTQGVQFFCETAAALAGGEPKLCNMKQTCGGVLVVERDGAVYSCDHFVDSKHRLGSVLTDSLAELARGETQRAFGSAKRLARSSECETCPYCSFCGGGCLKHRLVRSGSTEPNHNYLCGGLRSFFDYSVPLLQRARALRRQGNSPERIMTVVAQEQRQMWSRVGRNDPCPCGSGKKAKNCCLRRVP